MTVQVLTFFNNKGGVGKTSLVFHLAWMFAELGKRVVVVDLDPQANLTSAFLPEDDLESLWEGGARTGGNATIYQCLRPLTEVGDIGDAQTQRITAGLHLVPGDLALAGFEDFLSQEWPGALGSGSLFRPFRVLTAFWQVAQKAALQHSADLIMFDVGPNLGAINRCALIASDFVIVPLAADLFSLQGLRNLGPTLKRWRSDWDKRRSNWPDPAFPLPLGLMQPLGYVLMQHMERLSRPVRAYQKWADRIPGTYHTELGGAEGVAENPPDDPNCLARLRHFRSLVPMAQEVRKPIFRLTPADGAIGGHSAAVGDARGDFQRLANRILERIAAARPAT
ncbi:MAG: AAA family ATPase [Xanthomonadaceae bacterium]|jgi:cellulose biosynthesis protein BcsQ|nr:AAA family ATPase [Xanthomonadaceae bacterium]